VRCTHLFDTEAFTIHPYVLCSVVYIVKQVALTTVLAQFNVLLSLFS